MKRLLFILVPLAMMVGCSGNTVAGEYISKKPESFRLHASNTKIDNLYAGYSGLGVVTVENGVKSPPRAVSVKIDMEDDDDLGKGWQQLPKEYYSWFSFEPSNFVIQPGETRTFEFHVKVPTDARYTHKKYRCAMVVLPWVIVDQTTGENGEIINVVSNVCGDGVASEMYITMW